MERYISILVVLLMAAVWYRYRNMSSDNETDTMTNNTSIKGLRVVTNDRFLPHVTQGEAALRMYWQPGYTWQEETVERRWCIRVRGEPVPGVRLELTPCDFGNVPTQFTIHAAWPAVVDWVQFQVTGTELCLEAIPIQDVIFLNVCSALSPNQWFIATIDASRFEIRPLMEPDQCLTQIHHPRDDEEIVIQYCSVAREDETSYWVKNY